MIAGHDIVCFANDWDSDPLSKKHIMLRLARRNRVLWVNSIGNRRPTVTVRDLKRALKKLEDFRRGCRAVAESPNVHVFAPLALPFHRSAAAREFNRRFLSWSLRRACRRLGFRRPITWTFEPASADVVGELGERLVVYHCVDEFSRFTGAEREAILEMERRLLTRCDAFIASSEPLYEAKRPDTVNPHLVTHGVDVAHFRRACEGATVVPAELARLPRPVVGFFGLIADWVDLEVVRHAARARPRWSFVLIGDATADTAPVQGLPNVHLLGRRRYDDLPAYAKGFDVAVLNFACNELTQAANPLKVREYLAAGLPVVATDLPEVRRLGGLVRLYRGATGFLAQLDAAVSGRTGPQLGISRALDGESWDAKVEELSRIVQVLEAERRPAVQAAVAGLG